MVGHATTKLSNEPIVEVGCVATKGPQRVSQRVSQRGMVATTRHVLDDRLLVKLDGAASGRALRRGVRELEGLLALEVAEALDLEDAPREDVDLARLLDREQPALLGFVGDRVHEVVQRDSRLHRARELDEDRLGHVERHDARRRRERDQPRARREGDAASAIIHLSMTTFDVRYSAIGASSSWMEQPAAERSAEASESSKACSTFMSGSPWISRIFPEKTFFFPFFSTVSRPCLMA